jgi:hypothetical protein
MGSAGLAQMLPLVERCLDYMHEHLSAIIKLPIDFGCIHQSLLERLAGRLTVDELDQVQDSRDKLVGRIYMTKLEDFLAEGAKKAKEAGAIGALQQCVRCKRVFTPSQQEWMVCSQAKMVIDFHGAVVARHTPNPDWSIKRYLLRLCSQGLSWRTIYWRVWAMSHDMECRACEQRFTCQELGHCSHHLQPPTFKEPSSNEGTYSCCGQTVLRFDVSNKTASARQGCRARDHVVGAPSGKLLTPDRVLLASALARRELVEVPFESAYQLADTEVASPRDPADELTEVDEGSQDEDEDRSGPEIFLCVLAPLNACVAATWKTRTATAMTRTLLSAGRQRRWRGRRRRRPSRPRSSGSNDLSSATPPRPEPSPTACTRSGPNSGGGTCSPSPTRTASSTSASSSRPVARTGSPGVRCA